MLHRQRLVLELLEASGGEMDRLRLVKSVFLLRHELGFEEHFYGFVPYLHGPFSFCLYQELSKLAAKALVDLGTERVRLTNYGRRVRERPTTSGAKAVADFARDIRAKTTADLLAGIYAQYPWYTISAKDRRRRRMKRPTAEPAVYTVGYEGLLVDELLDLLLRAGIEVLVDTRHNPVSRRYGFHRSTLRRLCEDVGLEYRHFPALGIPGGWRRGAELDDLPTLFSRYEKEILPAATEELAEVEDLLCRRPAALLCAERLPQHCHRHRLAAAVTDRVRLPAIDLRCQDQMPLAFDA